MKGKSKVDNKNMILDASKCIHCGKCTKSCIFLRKYDIDIGNTGRLEELAYHCFLCGKCSRVCPIKIDGREIILDIRKKRVKKNRGKIDEKGYKLLIKEIQAGYLCEIRQDNRMFRSDNIVARCVNGCQISD